MSKQQLELAKKPCLVYYRDIVNIKNVLISLWGEEGKYSDEFYLKIIREALSFVYKKNDEIIAVCLIGKHNKKGVVGIDVLGVKKEYRSQGLGKSLLSYCIDNCMKRGFNTFQLHVATTNKIAIHLYEKLGFRKDPKIIINYYFNDPEGERDAYFMTLYKNNELKEKRNNQPKNNEKENNKNYELSTHNPYRKNYNYPYDKYDNVNECIHNNNLENNENNWNKEDEGINHQVFIYRNYKNNVNGEPF